MAEEPQDAYPATGARYYPDEGGIMWRGETYYPAAYARQVTDAMVERAAAVFAEVTGEPRAGRFERTMARAAVTAALGGDEHA